MKTCPKCGAEFGDANTLCPNDGEVLQKTDDLVGHTLAGKYRVEELLSKGGMGAVYRATHVLMEKTLAVKVLHPALAADEKIVARFTREAKAASRLSHPHALNVTDFGEDENGRVFLVMEYIRGRTLKEVVRSEGPMPLARVLTITRQVCGALEAAHAQGVVHRDLKSDNIMLEEVGGAGGEDWAKVLDFGIAKIKEPLGGTDPALTAPNLIIGTPQYMSPEQCSQAAEIDARSDIYSLGVILYEMFVGHVPFTGESPTAIMMKHMQEPAPSILDERGDLPAAVDRVVARALAKRPEDRFQNVGELAEALALAADAGESPVTNAGAASVAPAATAVAAAGTTGERAGVDTGRVVTPTGGHEPSRDTSEGEYDEATVVAARSAASPASPAHEAPSVLLDAPPPPSPAGFNPWRIAVPALAILVAVFVGFYVFQRGAGDAGAEEQAAPLSADPNSLPVQSASPATGAGESGVMPGTTAPVVPAGGTAATGGDALPGAVFENNNVNAQPSPSADANNADVVQQADEEDADAEPTPEATPAQRNAGTRRPPVLVEPTPARDNSDEDEEDAPPPPKPRTRPPPASTPAPATDIPRLTEPR